MKKKILTLLTLLVGVCSGAWAADATLTYAQPSATLDLQAVDLSSTLSQIKWNSREGNVSNGYELTSDYLVFPLQTLGYTCPSWCVKENFNNNKGTWTASDPFKADTYFFSSTGTDKNNVIKVTTTRPVAVKVTNCTGAYVYGATHNSNYTILNVYEVANNSDAYNTFEKVKTANTRSNGVVSVTGLTASKTYIVQVIGSSTSNANSYAIALKRAALTTQPTITTQPTSATYESGDDAADLTVAATASAGELSYQWYSNTDGDVTGKEADKIDGATSATLAAAKISTASAGTTYYYCIVTDSNGSTTSNKAAITVVNTIAPVISYTSATNTVSITCEGSGNIYYTLDNSLPTSSSTAYSTPFVLTNSSTVRAVAIKGGNASEVVFEKYKVDHSATAKAILGFGGGSHTSGVWTSTADGYILSSSNGGDIQYYTVFSGQDGFKLNHTCTYTLKISDNIKVTSIKFVGISRGDAVNDATIALDGFTPASGTIEKGTFVKTIEFTPESELGYGVSIDITTGGNQFGGYFEIYGTEYAPSVTAYDETTWDFTNWSAATINGVKADETNWHANEKSDNSGIDFTEKGRTIKISRSNNSLSYKVSEESSPKIAETDGLKFTCDAYGMGLIYNMASTDIGTYHGSQYIWLYGNKSKINIENVTKGSIIEIGVESHKDSEARYVSLNNATQTQGATSGDAAKAYQVCKWTVTTAGTITITPSKGLHIYYITLKKAKDATTITPANDKSTYVTTKALDFSDVEGLKAYKAAAAGSGSVTLEEVGAVPAGTPLMLIGTADTEYTVPVAASADEVGTNLLVAGDGTTEFDGSTYDYILYTDGKFYQIGSGSVAVGKAYLHCDSDPTAGARGLTLVFGDDDQTTAISEKGIVNSEQFTTVYDLQGRRVAQPTKGLYIVNGKKVIKK